MSGGMQILRHTLLLVYIPIKTGVLLVVVLQCFVPINLLSLKIS